MKKLTRLRLEREIEQRSELSAYRMVEVRGIVEYRRPERVGRKRLKGVVEISRGATELAWKCLMNELKRER